MRLLFPLLLASLAGNVLSESLRGTAAVVPEGVDTTDVARLHAHRRLACRTPAEKRTERCKKADEMMVKAQEGDEEAMDYVNTHREDYDDASEDKLTREELKRVQQSNFQHQDYNDMYRNRGMDDAEQLPGTVNAGQDPMSPAEARYYELKRQKLRGKTKQEKAEEYWKDKPKFNELSLKQQMDVVQQGKGELYGLSMGQEKAVIDRWRESRDKRLRKKRANEKDFNINDADYESLRPEDRTQHNLAKYRENTKDRKKLARLTPAEKEEKTDIERLKKLEKKRYAYNNEPGLYQFLPESKGTELKNKHKANAETGIAEINKRLRDRERKRDRDNEKLGDFIGKEFAKDKVAARVKDAMDVISPNLVSDVKQVLQSKLDEKKQKDKEAADPTNAEGYVDPDKFMANQEKIIADREDAERQRIRDQDAAANGQNNAAAADNNGQNDAAADNNDQVGANAQNAASDDSKNSASASADDNGQNDAPIDTADGIAAGEKDEEVDVAVVNKPNDDNGAEGNGAEGEGQ